MQRAACTPPPAGPSALRDCSPAPQPAATLRAATGCRLCALPAVDSVDVAWSPYDIDGRNFDWTGLAAAADWLFVMAYDTQSQVGCRPAAALHLGSSAWPAIMLRLAPPPPLLGGALAAADVHALRWQRQHAVRQRSARRAPVPGPGHPAQQAGAGPALVWLRLRLPAGTRWEASAARRGRLPHGERAVQGRGLQ